jgi:glycine cleavage system H protein
MDTRYTESHEYIRVEGEIGVIGITDFAQSQLGDVVFVELPQAGDKISKGAQAATIESVKTAAEINAPASGEVVEVNSALAETPGLINEDPFGKGWMLRVRLSDAAELDGLMDAGAYREFVKSVS